MFSLVASKPGHIVIIRFNFPFVSSPSDCSEETVLSVFHKQCLSVIQKQAR